MVGSRAQVAGVGEVRPSRRGTKRAFDSLVLYSFVVLGLPDGALGTAWPVMRKGFAAPLDYLGVVLLVGTAGSVLCSSVSGVVLGRLGTRGTIVLAGAAGATGAFGAVVAPSFWAFAAAGGFLGVAAGLLDSSVNTSVAMTGRNRLLNMVHGTYGVGTTVAPLVVTAAVVAGSWRGSYGVVFAAELLLVAAWWLAGRDVGGVRSGQAPTSPAAWGTTATADAGGSEAGSLAGGRHQASVAPVSSSTRRARRRRVVAVVGLGLVVFMVYTGFEVSAGQWSPSFDRSVLHMGATTTGVVTFGYWGALTVTRFALALPKRPLAPELVVRWGCLVALGGAALLWWRPVAAVATVGLVVVGAALAGVFPALVALTPGRVGEQLARHVIGWQIGAASVGGSAISAAFGLAFQHLGLSALGPALVIVAVLLVAGSLALERAQC
jgi:fucose permease